MKCGNSILAKACFRMRYFPPSPNRLLFLRPQILRKKLKLGIHGQPRFAVSVNSDLPSRRHHHLARNLPGRGDGEGGRENPPVEPEPSTFPELTPTDSAEEPKV